jgi:hypothetical protein
VGSKQSFWETLPRECWRKMTAADWDKLPEGCKRVTEEGFHLFLLTAGRVTSITPVIIREQEGGKAE